MKKGPVLQKKTYFCLVCKSKQLQIFSYKDFFYFRCPTCFLVSTYPFPSSQQIIDHYKKKFIKGNYTLLQSFAKQYKKVYENFANELEQYVKKNNQKLSKKKLLDIGCFTGEFLEVLQKKKTIISGIELQKEAVEIANKKFGKRIVIQKDILADKTSKPIYDIITMLGLVEHVTDPAELISHVSVQLKKNGILMIQTPNSNSLFARILGKYWPPFAPIEHIHLFSRESLTLLLAENGFKDITYKQSWKLLPIAYVYNMLENFGPEFHFLLSPMQFLLNGLKNICLPFYIGEMLIFAQKK